MNAPNYFQIAPFNGANPGQFYIQSHGTRAGKPLQMPSAQCLAVHTDCPQAFEVAQCLYLSDAYAYAGRAFPVLRADAVGLVLGQALDLPFCPQALDTLRVALYEAQHAREIADEWLTYARNFARSLYNAARTTQPAAVAE